MAQSHDSGHPNGSYRDAQRYAPRAPTQIPTNEDLALADDHYNQRYPFSIVWGPLPIITWIFPCIGHMGIADSQGFVHDFQSAYNVVTDNFMTGPIFKTYRFTPQQLSARPLPAGTTPAQAWDRAVSASDRHYEQTVHSICSNNCHHHTASALTFYGRSTSMLQAWALISFRGRYTSWGALLCTYIPFLILVALGLGLGLGLGTGR